IRLFEINLNDPYQRNSEEFEATADQSYMDRIINEAPNYFDLETGIGKTIRMTRVRLHTDDFKLSLLGTDIATLPYEAGIHYRGLYNDGNGAISSLSFINGKLHGLIVEEGSQWEIAAIEEENGKYLFRKSESSGSISGFSCGILEVPGRKMTEIDNNTQGIACKTVKVSLECDYKIFRDFQQNAVATADYISALMNQVSALYQSENIDLQIQEIKVWTSDDPYSSISTAGELLTAFRTTKGSNFNGTLSHFLTTRSIGGGMAFLDVLCNKDYAHGVSSILTFFNNAPSYSWSVEVLAHELGHNFGSNHTHWCGWQRADGTTGPLDNCYSSDGGCSPGPTPQNGGTIMSYCHLTTQGINFSKGFGTEPGSVIRERLTNSTCIASGGSEPIGTTTTNINATTARLEWAPVPNAINYEAEYRLSGTTTWI
ncbi:MAG: zinc-dependent metalloprotease, partial [Bacteroidota bacterium]